MKEFWFIFGHVYIKWHAIMNRTEQQAIAAAFTGAGKIYMTINIILKNKHIEQHRSVKDLTTQMNWQQ